MIYRMKLISSFIAMSKAQATNAQQVVIRNSSGAATPKATQMPKKDENLVETTSFAFNLFWGQLKLDEVFPYSIALNDEQRENLKALLDPTAKYIEVFNRNFPN
jgi:uncharacterized lipoprotein YddW (UPF0748 family)